MPVTVTNLIQGPGTIWLAPFGATEPTTAIAVPAAAWIDAGGTLKGLELSIKQTYATLDVDQVADIPGRRLQSRIVSIKTQLAEPTMDNLTTVLNELAAAAAVTGSRTFDPSAGNPGAVPNYVAVMIDGQAPGGFARRVIVRRALQVDDTGVKHDKADQAVLPATFESHYVSASIRPFRVIDQTA